MGDGAQDVKTQPSWDGLYEIASAQGGLFSTHQAQEVGYSTHLLHHHAKRGRVRRMRRGIYRLVHFPYDENEELIVVWLWSDQAGVISHDTALALHELSDALPAKIHLTLPTSWAKMRLRVIDNVTLHSADVIPSDRDWFGAVPLTTPRRTLNDCAQAGLSPDLLRQAAQQAMQRGLVVRSDLGTVERALAAYGGLP